MYLADLIKREKQFDKIMKLFGYANPYRMLNLCQQIADIQGEILTVNVPFPEIFYYKIVKLILIIKIIPISMSIGKLVGFLFHIALPFRFHAALFLR